jgi:hypothetical protein
LEIKNLKANSNQNKQFTIEELLNFKGNFLDIDKNGGAGGGGGGVNTLD